MPVTFTDTWLRKSKKPKRYAESGRRGFCLVVYPSGVQAFQYRYKLDGVQKIAHIGYFPDTALADAHLEYERLRSLARKKIDPKARPVDETGPTFGDVAEDWYKQVCLAQVKNKAGQWVKHPKRKPLKAPEYKRIQLDTHLLPFWKNKLLKAISRPDANRRLDEIIAAKAPVMANRVGATIGQIWAWALDEGLIDATPMQGLSKRGGREQPRERVLNDDEIRTFWTKLESSELDEITIAALRLCLLTGTRRSEIAGARWSEVDGDTWTIPAARIKTEHRNEKPKDHVVPLSDLALEVLDGVRDLHKTFVFPSPGEGPIRPHSLSRAVNRKLKHFGIGKFTPHDLRRTVRSKLAELGVQPVVAKKVLNHALEGMDAVYDRHEYAKEKRDALQLWADHVRAVIANESPKVVPFKAAS